MQALAYLHPLLQALVLLLGFNVMSLGLKTRNMRMSEAATEFQKRVFARKHYQRGKYFLILYSIGYFDGLASNIFLRQKALFMSSHAYFASISLGLFLLAGKFGKSLTHQRAPDREDYDLHSWSALGGLFLSLANVVTGYSLLP